MGYCFDVMNKMRRNLITIVWGNTLSIIQIQITAAREKRSISQQMTLVSLTVDILTSFVDPKPRLLFDENPLEAHDFQSKSLLREHSWGWGWLVKKICLHSNVSRETSESRQSLKPSLPSFLLVKPIWLQESAPCLVTSGLGVRCSFPRDGNRGRSR